jgi:hypothetical protein
MADETIARESSRASQNQIAETRETRQRFNLRAFAPGETSDLREPSREKCSHAV